MKRIVLLLLACFPSVFMLAQVPETYWIPDNVGQFNITLFAQLSLAGDIPNSQDSPVANYELGVFDQDGKCCGVAFPPTWKANTHRWVYSLAIQGETGSSYTFKLYDHATDQEQVLSMACSEDVDRYEFNVVEDASSPNYGDGYTYGYTYAPDSLHFMPAQTLELVGGEWNRISLYVESDNLLEMLEEGMGESGSLIEAPNSSTEYYGPEEGWLGDLQEEGVIYNEEMYYVLTTADVTVTLTGVPADPSAHPITILPNEWNRIGFPYSEAVAVNDALAGFPAVDGDMIESPDGSLYYVEGEGWMGDFEEFTPGVGYMFQSFSDEERTLVFGTGAPSAKTRRTSPDSGRIPGERMRPTNKNGK